MTGFDTGRIERVRLHAGPTLDQALAPDDARMVACPSRSITARGGTVVHLGERHDRQLRLVLAAAQARAARPSSVA